jgi:uncharacterized protein YceH (UPF0502 family)
MAEPLAADLGRRPGQKEERWTCLLSSTEFEEDPASESMDSTPNVGGPTALSRSDTDDDLDGRFGALQSELADLRDQIVDLRADLGALRSSLGG